MSNRIAESATARWAFVALSSALLVGTIGCRRSSPAPETAAAGSGSGMGSFVPFEASGEGSGAGATLAVPVDAAALVNGVAVVTKTEVDAQLAEIVERYERLPDREPTTPRWRNERRRLLVQTAVHDRLIADHVATTSPEVTDEQLQTFVRGAIGEVYDDERLFERFLQSH